MVWLHPVLGILAVLLILWTGMAGLSARQRDPSAPAKRRLHHRFAPVAGLLAGLAAVAGTLTVIFVRDDLDVAASWHFRAGWLCVLLATGSWFSSRQLHQRPGRRRLHPWIGLALMATAVAV
ncbi:MAG: DUF4079 family protein, partial [Oligoflexia bacterium]|nr:DUF4079 family protein [Oligoflexia bacterium]